MLVRALMKKVRAVAPDDDMGTAFRAVVASGRRHLPVVDGDRLVGIVSEWDLLRAWARQDSRTLRVRQVMTSNVHSANPNEQLVAIPQRLVDEGVGCLPVVENDKLLGIVAVSDVVAAIAHEHFAARRPSKKAIARKRPASKKKARVGKR
jgi:CBS domain-containing protein